MALHCVALAFALLVAIAALPARAGEFSNPEPVEIVHYGGHAMEPFITRDGRYLLFNNLNDPSENTDLHCAERITATSFRYGGKIDGANTKALEGVPTLDRHAVLHLAAQLPRDALDYPAFKLDDARTEAKGILARAAKGKDPVL